MKKLIVFAASLMMTLPVWAQLPSAGPDAAEPDSDKNPMSAVYKNLMRTGRECRPSISLRRCSALCPQSCLRRREVELLTCL